MLTCVLENKELNRRLQAFEMVCHQNGLRVTNQRREIFKAVAASHQHPTAEEVCCSVRKKMANVSLDTVYRTLASLEKMNLLIRVGTPEKERFDADLRPHAHFICSVCGNVYDIFPPADLEPWDPPELDCGKITHLNVQLKGICRRCGK